MKRILLILSIFSTVALGVTIKNNISLNVFNAGELSPLINSRSDLAQYRVGAKTLENMIVRSQGPIQRRPGTEYIATAKYNSNVRLISFDYSTELSFIIEMGHEYMRFFKTENGVSGAIMDGDDPNIPYEIVTPYDGNDVNDIQFAQENKSMRFVHPDYWPNKLTYFSDNNWVFQNIDNKWGPFLKENTTVVAIEPNFSTTGGKTDYYDYGDDESLEIYYSPIFGRKWYGQTFTASASYDVNQIALKLYSGDTDGTLYVRIRACSGGLPTGSDLAVASAPISEFASYSSNGYWYYFDLDPNIALVEGTQYAILAEADGDHDLFIRSASTNPSYNGGTSLYSKTLTTETWKADSSKDLMFKVIDVNNTTVISENGTLIATGDIFDPNHVGSIWKLTQKIYNNNITGELDEPDGTSESLEITGDYLFHYDGTFGGTAELQKSDDNVNWDTVHTIYHPSSKTTNYDYAGTEINEDYYYRVKMVSYSSGNLHYSLLAYNTNSTGYARITGYIDANEVYINIIEPFANTSATTKWCEGAWSDFRGWPRTIAMHEQRAIYGGSESYPETVWSSIIAEDSEDYDNFYTGNAELDNQAWTYILPGNNPIQWMVSSEYLLIGTSKGVGRLGFSDRAITPTVDPIYRIQAVNGSEYRQAIPTSDAVLFLERGRKKLRELSYTYTSERYIAPDMTILSEHITGDGITQMAFQERPDPILWCIREDGALLSFTYNRHYGVQSWAKHITDGDFQSVAVDDSQSREDDVWLAVNRTINSTDYTYIELMKDWNWGADQNDMWFVDCGTTDINNISYLEGAEVTILADGEPNGTYTVASGVVDPCGTSTYYTVGLPYTSTFETMPLMSYDQNYQASASYLVRVQNLVLDLYKTMDFNLGADSTNVSTIENDDLYTGVKKVEFPRGQYREMSMHFDCNDPTPFTLRGITASLSVDYVD